MSKKILALIGDYYHHREYLESGIRQSLAQEKLDIQVESDYSKVPWDKLSTFDLILLSLEGRVEPNESDAIWMAQKHQEALVEYVENGGGFLVLHSGLASYPTDGIYRKMVKGHFVHHPAEHPVVHVKVMGGSHPILEGVEDFEVVDEQYFVECDEADTNVLLEGRSEPFGSSAAGWAHEYGKGKVCCLTPGHTGEVLTHPMMQRLILNGVRWCL